ncbi:hypothetical protein Pmani_025509 [Petrolisthes manimaculis]|uniref:Uncharacterized protein n=1 Tax=Petrolisthes manimaculis TaxID=1843537 RepID=A0AAE1P7S2_9EUCA|nr:hypothetical protein Pmani_025509 [Petrolisthes manimaculis]
MMKERQCKISIRNSTLEVRGRKNKARRYPRKRRARQEGLNRSNVEQEKENDQEGRLVGSDRRRGKTWQESEGSGSRGKDCGVHGDIGSMIRDKKKEGRGQNIDRQVDRNKDKME